MLLRSLDLRRYLGEKICALYKSFFENRLRRTPLLIRQNWVVFKRRRRCIVHYDTVTERPRGFGIVARTKFPRRGGKGWKKGCVAVGH